MLCPLNTQCEGALCADCTRCMIHCQCGGGE